MTRTFNSRTRTLTLAGKRYPVRELDASPAYGAGAGYAVGEYCVWLAGDGADTCDCAAFTFTASDKGPCKHAVALRAARDAGLLEDARERPAAPPVAAADVERMAYDAGLAALEARYAATVAASESYAAFAALPLPSCPFSGERRCD